MKAFTIFFTKKPATKTMTFKCDALDKWDAIKQFNKYYRKDSVRIVKISEK